MALDPGQSYWPLNRFGNAKEPDKQVGIAFFDANTQNLILLADKDIDAGKFGSWMKKGRLGAYKKDIDNPRAKRS